MSCEHACALVRAHGESGWTGRLIPLTVDGLIYASSMVLLDSARRCVRVPALARWLLGLGIVATLAANTAHGLGHGPIGAMVAAWPAVALDIRSGVLAVDRLPSELDPAEQYGISRDVIRKAKEQLAGEGWLIVLHGRGTFVAHPTTPGDSE